MKRLLFFLVAIQLTIGVSLAQKFTTFELSNTVTTSCPGSSLCFNGAAEPAIRANLSGEFFASSENGLTAGTLAWRSSDGGAHYVDLVPPESLSRATDSTFQPGGGDTDIAVATAKNALGFYNVYVASLSLANVDVSTSRDNGGAWSLNPTSATIPGDDREWIAADGASKVCISYRAMTVGTQIVVNCSFDEGTTFTQLGNVFDVNHESFAFFNARIGNLAIDPNNHFIYQVFAGVKDNNEALTCLNCDLHVVWMGVSTDGGKTFTDFPVFINPDTTVGYEHQFPNVSVDRAGNVYAVYSDNHNVSYSFSTNHGQTWSGPFVVNRSPSNTAIFPWSVAGGASKIDIVWYGTSFFKSATPPDSYPSTASWFVYFAQNLKATTPGSSFSQVKATPVVHFGGVCEGGVACTGNRDLFDDFQIAASPVTGLASITYSDDQFTNDGNDPPQPGCTPSASNTISCDHTSIATQISGTGVK